MSREAAAALISCATNRQGATPAPASPASALNELRTLGLIGNGNGLTRKGTIRREQLVDELTTW